MALRHWTVALLALLLALAPAASAQERATRGEPRRAQESRSQDAKPNGLDNKESKESAPAGGVLRLLPPDSVSAKKLVVAGRTIDYTVTAGTFSLFDQNGERSAAVFYTAYVAKGADA